MYYNVKSLNIFTGYFEYVKQIKNEECYTENPLLYRLATCEYEKPVHSRRCTSCSDVIEKHNVPHCERCQNEMINGQQLRICSMRRKCWGHEVR